MRFLEFHFIEDQTSFVLAEDQIRAAVQVEEDDEKWPGAVSLVTTEGEWLVHETYDEVLEKLRAK